MSISPPTHLIFGKVKDTENIYYSTKHQVRGLCVGGDMAILQSLYKMDRTLYFVINKIQRKELNEIGENDPY